ncbi:hypothetical protein CYMTET_43343 [Cymbomonas tetramitiformis]|uniref:Uncharacterized protein n=1 Tax=Cymbomonas tetramitiformis TaxID=36881 RepID=A0AAE0F0P3_9CHLO|nr:hypothetical protein CYMTET_43343 [Cymbomonas tetramitiformis]
MLCTSHGADSAIHQTLGLLIMVAEDPWESAIQPLLTTTDKALLRMTCRELREKYRRCVQMRVSETLSASPSLHLFTKASLPGKKFSDGTCHFIAGKGRVDMLEYARREEAWDVRTTRAAASNGHLDCLRYAHENGCPWDVSHGCPLGLSTFLAAASNGHEDCLRYAYENDWIIEYELLQEMGTLVVCGTPTKTDAKFVV